MVIGRKLREERQLAGLSQAALGAKIGNRSQRIISKYESGEASIPLTVLLRICHELDLPLGWLLEAVSTESRVQFERDEFRRKGLSVFRVLRDFLIMDLGRVRRDPSLHPDLKRAYELEVERLRHIRSEDLTPQFFNDFILSILRRASVLMDERRDHR
jgi:transcriptional regulator with XRE-family HTH domain